MMKPDNYTFSNDTHNMTGTEIFASFSNSKNDQENNTNND